MALDRMSAAQEFSLTEVAEKVAEQYPDAEIIAARLRHFAAEWQIPYLETDILRIAETTVMARKDWLESHQPTPTGGWVERKRSDRRAKERRKADRRKRERRRSGFAALVAEFFRFGMGSDRRHKERRAASDRRSRDRRRFVRRHSER